MADLAHYDRLQRAFDGLLQDLSATWPKQDLEYVREEVGHGEYGDALENLVALGLRNGLGFDPDQVRLLEDLAALMELGGSSLLAQLREAGGQNAYASAPRGQTSVDFRPRWLDSLKQVALTFVLTSVTLALVMAASVLLGTAANGSLPVYSIEAGSSASSASTASRIVSSGMFFLLLAGLIWGPVRRWWQMRRETAILSS